MLDTTEHRTRLPSALRHTLQCLSAHCTMCESGLDMSIEVPDLLGDVNLLEVLLSPWNLQGFGSSGNRAGVR